MRSAIMSLALVLIGWQLPAVGADSTEQAQYTIKQQEPTVGSTIRREIIKAGNIPLDKRYAQLSVDEKRRLRAQYDQLYDTDEPPFPAEGLMPIYRTLGQAYEKLGLKGKGPLTLYVRVDEQGKPTAVSVTESPDPKITQVAAYALMLQTYKPAMCGGSHCAMQYIFHAELVGPEEHLGQEAATAVRIAPAGM